jgi:hypothetical protein
MFMGFPLSQVSRHHDAPERHYKNRAALNASADPQQAARMRAFAHRPGAVGLNWRTRAVRESTRSGALVLGTR